MKMLIESNWPADVSKPSINPVIHCWKTLNPQTIHLKHNSEPQTYGLNLPSKWKRWIQQAKLDILSRSVQACLCCGPCRVPKFYPFHSYAKLFLSRSRNRYKLQMAQESGSKIRSAMSLFLTQICRFANGFYDSFC